MTVYLFSLRAAKTITGHTSRTEMRCLMAAIEVFFLSRARLYALQLEQKGSTVSGARQPRSGVYITFGGAAEKCLCDRGSEAAICG